MRVAISILLTSAAGGLLAGCMVSRPAATPANRCDLSTTPVKLGFHGEGPRSEDLVDVRTPAGVNMLATPRKTPAATLEQDALKAVLTDVGFLSTAATRGPLRRHLVLSGGGHNGSFGAGFLSGIGPLDYDVVTGVSSGAMQATLVFLGAEESPSDRQLPPAEDFPPDRRWHTREDPDPTRPPPEGDSSRPVNLDDMVASYTIRQQKTLFNFAGRMGMIRHARLGDLEPLRGRIERVFTDGMFVQLKDWADKNPRPRQLYVALLDLDSGDVVRVDMLDLAKRYEGEQKQHVRDCFINVLIASASEPTGPPPVVISSAPRRADAARGVTIDDVLYADAGLRYGVLAADDLVAQESAAKSFTAAVRAANLTRFRPWAQASGDGSAAPPVIQTDIILNDRRDVKRERMKEYSVLDLMGRGRKIMVNQIFGFSIDAIRSRASPEYQVRIAYIRADDVKPDQPARGVVFDPAYMIEMIKCGRKRALGGDWDQVIGGPAWNRPPREYCLAQTTAAP